MPTNLWRISRHDDLDGIGGEKADGRWHTAAKGQRIVYLSEHPAVALLEVLANLKGNPRLFPDAYRMMKLDVHPNVWSAAQHVDPSSIAPQHDPGAPHLASEMWVPQNSTPTQIPHPTHISFEGEALQ
jgi:RES domain-containing protein